MKISLINRYPIFFCVFCVFLTLVVYQKYLSQETVHLYIWNESGKTGDIVYYSYENGVWLHPVNHLISNGIAEVVMQKNRFSTEAKFSVTVGNQLNHFDCIAEFIRSSTQKKTLIKHSGSCALTELSPNHLALIIEAQGKSLHHV